MGVSRTRLGDPRTGLASPGEITLFWARQDDIMTDGHEDMGTEGRKCYLNMAPSGLGQTHKQTYTRLTYVKEVATTSTLKSGRPAPREHLCFSLQNL